MKNAKYARLVNGAIEYAPKPLIIGGEEVWTNIPSVYNDAGWYTVELHDMPAEEGYTYEECWVENSGAQKIVQNWIAHEMPQEDPEARLSLEDRLNDIEIAICELYDALI